MRKYILYAGVNGAGKSTLYMTTHYQDMLPRVNTDEILRELLLIRKQPYVDIRYYGQFIGQSNWDM